MKAKINANSGPTGPKPTKPGKVLAAISIVLLCGLAIWASLGITSSSALPGFIKVAENEMAVVGLGSGEFSVHGPGTHWIGFDTPTVYQRSFRYDFSDDWSAPVRFNDGGQAKVSGSIDCVLPADEELFRRIHLHYGSQEKFEHEFLSKVIDRSVQMTGLLMSTMESYRNRKALHDLVADQVVNGLYRTADRKARQKDPITGSERTVTIVEPVRNAGAPGGISRLEHSPLTANGIKVLNITIEKVQYEPKTEKLLPK
jgi:hypothetical protein